ncbi:DUF2335 domain-containing protein [Flavobacterium johnsoniae]|uniref:Uncharacterized membrane protein n=1 Tax=Flavobacterium johnsoniae TaxID=986 RepID=A0A1M5IY82_FLAJO|nr:DUF2335 domain-containing protein [Flavobacterium johnsoniae]SHG33297.1 Uncharacterized membrane protein [Flavobacterium johnsoniae]
MSKQNEKKRTKPSSLPERKIIPQDESSSVEELNAEIVEVKEELESLNPHIFDGIGDKKKGELLKSFTQLTMRVERHHSGPLPPAEMLVQYDTVIPDGANRIMIMAEKQQEHRMAMESKVVTSQLSQSFKGQILGFILCFLALAASVYLGVTGHEGIGGAIGTTTIVSMGIIFVLGKRPRPSGKDEKED